MRIVSKDIVFDGPVSKIHEFPEDYAINGHIYSKVNLIPQPLSFAKMTAPSSKTPDISCLQMADVRGNFLFNRSDSTYITDSNDPTVFYTIHSTGEKGTYYIFKMKKESNGQYIEIGKATSYSSSQIPTSEIIDQDLTNLYILTHTSSEGTYLSVVNKNTLIFTHYNLGTLRAKLVRKNATFLYFAATTVTGYFHLFKIQRSSGTKTFIFQEGTASSFIAMSIPTLLDENTIYYGRDGYVSPTNLNHEIHIYELKVNWDADTVVNTKSTLDLNGILTTLTYTNASRVYECIEYFFVENNGKKYLNLAIYQSGSNGSLYLDQEYSGILTFEMTGANSFKLINTIRANAYYYLGLLKTNNNNTLVMPHKLGVHILQWNKISNIFEIVSSIATAPLKIGIDSFSNLWILYENAEVEILSNTVALKIEADFEKDEYQFTGQDISDNVIVKVQNFLGERIISTLNLQLVGNVVFTENNSKTIQKTTNNISDLSVPVTIKNSGLIQVFANVI